MIILQLLIQVQLRGHSLHLEDKQNNTTELSCNHFSDQVHINEAQIRNPTILSRVALPSSGLRIESSNLIYSEDDRVRE